jgi:threonine dehydrogenase-like Zn-dependent dehydrogenase
MKALTWHGKQDVRIDTVPDPGIQEPGDIVVRVTATAICGSDLHIYDGFVPQMEPGDIPGHEFMGEVVEVGAEVTRFQRGDRVVVPFVIACGHCFFCERRLWSLCDNTNPDAHSAFAQADRIALTSLCQLDDLFCNDLSLDRIDWPGAACATALRTRR